MRLPTKPTGWGTGPVTMAPVMPAPAPPTIPEPSKRWTAKCERCRNKVEAWGAYTQFVEGLEAKGWRVITMQTVKGPPGALTFCPDHRGEG